MTVTKATAGGGRGETIAARLRELGVRGVLVQMAERGQLIALRCEMPQCYCPKGRAHFDAKSIPPPKWAPSPDHYPILKSAGGQLRPDNVRLSHVFCNNRDYGWRTKIKALLAKEMSLEAIAQELNGGKFRPLMAGTSGRLPQYGRRSSPRPPAFASQPLPVR